MAWFSLESKLYGVFRVIVEVFLPSNTKLLSSILEWMLCFPPVARNVRLLCGGLPISRQDANLCVRYLDINVVLACPTRFLLCGCLVGQPLAVCSFLKLFLLLSLPWLVVALMARSTGDLEPCLMHLVLLHT